MLRETRVENGALRGVACGWPSITAYYGIPYAAPPVGELRWRPPEPAKDWDGVRDCARPSAKCPQLGVGPGSFYEREFYPAEEPQSEDCLYLNIWTPAGKPGEKLPVIFWIHGGAFMTGYGHSAHFDGEHFARQGVILVTINYRLNIFGWMVGPELDAENEHGISGNYGLQDQIAALKWVHRNIEAFGGDPGNITIAGQSAGAASVQCLIDSPMTEGYYSKAILQSGGGPIPFLDLDPVDLRSAEARNDLSVLGVSTIEEARKIPAMELSARWIKAFLANQGKLNLSDRFPVVDGYYLPKKTVDRIKDGDEPKIPILIGYTDNEGLVMANDRKGLEDIVNVSLPEFGGIYLDSCPQDGPEFEAFKKRMTSETAQAAAEAYALIRERQGKGETYIYSFDRKLPGDEAGPFHASDLWYVFRTLTRSWRPWEAEDYMLAYACNTYWAEFAKHGTPNGDRQPELAHWAPYRKYRPYTMKLDKLCHMVERNGNDRVAARREALMKSCGM